MATIRDSVINIVDDDAMHLSMMQFMLRRLGFSRVQTFGDAEHAFETMQNETPDLIISDWNMDPLDGLELLKMVRQDTVLKEVPFIMVTANTSECYWHTAITEGVTDFLFKPFRFDTLRASVEIALNITGDLSSPKQQKVQYGNTPATQLI